MSVESLSRIAQIKSPSDFLGAVMGRSGKSDITREDVLGAMANHRDKLGQAIFFYWLFGSGQEEAFELSEDCAKGGWLVSTPFMADTAFLEKFGHSAVMQIISPKKPHYVIADINNITVDAVRKNSSKYTSQTNFLNELTRRFNQSLLNAKREFLSHFYDE